MTTEPGGDANIKAAWEAVRGKRGAQWDGALNGVVSFGTRFLDFAVQNLNLDLGEQLDSWSEVTQVDDFPDLGPLVARYPNKEGQPGGDPAIELDVPLPHLTAECAWFQFDESVKAIGIDLTRFASGAVRGEALYLARQGELEAAGAGHHAREHLLRPSRGRHRRDVSRARDGAFFLARSSPVLPLEGGTSTETHTYAEFEASTFGCGSAGTEVVTFTVTPTVALGAP